MTQPMTETEWQTCCDPQAMLDFLRSSGKLSERKASLFACAVVRRVYHLLADERSENAIEAAERQADGSLSAQEFEAIRQTMDRAGWDAFLARYAAEAEADFCARSFYSAASAKEFATLAAHTALRLGTDVPPEQSATYAIVAQGRPPHVLAAIAAAEEAGVGPLVEQEREQAAGAGAEQLSELFDRFQAARRHAKETETTAQCVLLRDFFGVPFQPTPTIGGAALAWNERIVVRLAQNIYEDRHLPDGMLDLARLAVLADALEEAGVTDTLLLEHLRGPGPHVLGCFAVDAILGRT
jgi:hypothetical protein